MADFREGLRLIRTRQHRLAFLLTGIVPFVIVAGFVTSPSADLLVGFIVAAAAYGAFLLAYSLRVAFTECPRCESFYHWSWWSNPWTQRCLHCGLPLDDASERRDSR